MAGNGGRRIFECGDGLTFRVLPVGFFVWFSGILCAVSGLRLQWIVTRDPAGGERIFSPAASLTIK